MGKPVLQTPHESPPWTETGVKENTATQDYTKPKTTNREDNYNGALTSILHCSN